MIEIISKIFIKDRKNYDSPAVRRAYGIICSACGIALNILLCVFKLAASSFTGSVAIAVDALHNLTDSASSAVSLLSFLLSGQKKTKKFPLGKGRIEYIAGFIIAIVLIATGIEAAKSSVTKIINPEPVTFSAVSVLLLAVSVVTKFYMAHFNSRYGKKISSAALKASAADCLCDSISTLIAIISVVSVRFTALNIDAWGGLAVSMFILFAGIKSATDTTRLIIGTPPDEDTITEITKTLLLFPEIDDVCNIFLHDYGPENSILDIKVKFRDGLTLADTSDAVDRSSQQITSTTGYHVQIVI